jgi:plasmid maintenance system antidote protein VapI
MPINDDLREAIRNSKLSVVELASECGIHRQVIDRFLTGERDMRLSTAAKLAEVLGLALKKERRK